MTEAEIINQLERKLNEAYETLGCDRVTIRRYEIDSAHRSMENERLRKELHELKAAQKQLEKKEEA